MSIYQLRQIRKRRYKRWPERRPRGQKSGMLSAEERERIEELYEQGLDLSEIARQVGRSVTSVRRVTVDRACPRAEGSQGLHGIETKEGCQDE